MHFVIIPSTTREFSKVRQSRRIFKVHTRKTINVRQCSNEIFLLNLYSFNVGLVGTRKKLNVHCDKLELFFHGRTDKSR